MCQRGQHSKAKILIGSTKSAFNSHYSLICLVGWFTQMNFLKYWRKKKFFKLKTEIDLSKLET